MTSLCGKNKNKGENTPDIFLCVRQLIWFVFEKAAVARKIYCFTMNDWERPFLWGNPI